MPIFQSLSFSFWVRWWTISLVNVEYRKALLHSADLKQLHVHFLIKSLVYTVETMRYFLWKRLHERRVRLPNREYHHLRERFPTMSHLSYQGFQYGLFCLKKAIDQHKKHWLLSNHCLNQQVLPPCFLIWSTPSAWQQVLLSECKTQCLVSLYTPETCFH